jgi:prepilin-type N-terminal cleavage/methylation domain-containing protein
MSARLRDKPEGSAFTLVEMLVVIAVLAVLVGLIVPALANARKSARLLLCVSNVRSQYQLVAAYANEFGDVLPPKIDYLTEEVNGSEQGPTPWLINRLLARWSGTPFQGAPGFETPTGIWRCPEVAPADDATERWSHAGVIHHAPNSWMFSEYVVDDVHGSLGITSEAYGWWNWRFGGFRPRKMAEISRPDDIVSLIDNTNYFVAAHGHRDAHQSCGLSDDVVAGETPTHGENHGSHDDLRKRSAAFADGHALAISSDPMYWYDGTTPYFFENQPAMRLNHREVERFMWYTVPLPPSSDES